MNGQQLYLSLEPLYVEQLLHLSDARHLQLLAQLDLVIQAVEHDLLDALVRHVPLLVDLKHQRLHDAIFLKDLSLLLEHRFHPRGILDESFGRRFLPTLQEQHIHDVLHALFNLVFHGYNVFY